MFRYALQNNFNNWKHLPNKLRAGANASPKNCNSNFEFWRFSNVNTFHRDKRYIFRLFSTTEVAVEFKYVHGKCAVICGEDVPAEELQKDVTDRFYYLEVRFTSVL